MSTNTLTLEQAYHNYTRGGQIAIFSAGRLIATATEDVQLSYLHEYAEERPDRSTDRSATNSKGELANCIVAREGGDVKWR
ncbi:MAG: hypothetical protein FWF06_06375 [Symbiobacteriaceae bacterium]|nr:hypothetical protein [Symbiobacteriaceae bacterium]